MFATIVVGIVFFITTLLMMSAVWYALDRIMYPKKAELEQKVALAIEGKQIGFAWGKFTVIFAVWFVCGIFLFDM